MSAADRLVRENLVNSLVAGVATGMGASGADMATAAGAAQIEVQNNQVALPLPAPIFTPNDPKSPFKVPGLEWLTGNKGDGVIADPASQLDPSAGVHVTPNPGQQAADAIFTPIADAVNGWIDSIKTMAGGDNGGRQANPSKADSPVWQDLKSAGNGVKTDGVRYYEWDYTHNDIEVYDKRGRHIGSADPVTGELYKSAVPGRKLAR
ncbi:Cytotoxic [Caballeronia glebae]|uniref:Cytotoxic n=2 Tax=Caballeronia glebae TaxID=1777143 RepID=A0A158DWP6_9BURK|nr:Cytotoxic [Caballeronia glebae]